MQNPCRRSVCISRNTNLLFIAKATPRNNMNIKSDFEQEELIWHCRFQLPTMRNDLAWKLLLLAIFVVKIHAQSFNKNATRTNDTKLWRLSIDFLTALNSHRPIKRLIAFYEENSRDGECFYRSISSNRMLYISLN